MIGPTTQNDAAWGLAVDAAAVRLVRVTRTGAGFRIDRRRRQALDGGSSASNVAAALAALLPEAAGEPMGACLPDELTLYRALSLPKAEPAVFEKMVAGQLDVLLPAEANAFVSAWSQADDPLAAGQQRVLLCATSRQSVDRLAGPCKRLGHEPELIVGSALALGAAHAALVPPEAAPVLLLDVAAASTSLVIVAEGRTVACAVIDQGADDWPDPDSPDAEWVQQLHEAHTDCAALLGPGARTQRCVLYGPHAQRPALAERVFSALGLATAPASTPTALNAPGAEAGQFADEAPAVGAALLALAPAPSAPVLAAKAPAPAPSLLRKPWVWAAAGAWLAAAAIGLSVLDRHEADRLEQVAARLQARTSGPNSLDVQLAVARRLAAAPAPPLVILDELSRVAPAKIILNTWRCDGAGQVVLAGVAPNEKDFNDLLTKLQGSSLFGGLQYKSVRKDKGKFRFEISFVAAAGARPADRGAATQPAATQPATQPASQPRSRP